MPLCRFWPTDRCPWSLLNFGELEAEESGRAAGESGLMSFKQRDAQKETDSQQTTS